MSAESSMTHSPGVSAASALSIFNGVVHGWELHQMACRDHQHRGPQADDFPSLTHRRSRRDFEDGFDSSRSVGDAPAVAASRLARNGVCDDTDLRRAQHMRIDRESPSLGFGLHPPRAHSLVQQPRQVCKGIDGETARQS